MRLNYIILLVFVTSLAILHQAPAASADDSLPAKVRITVLMTILSYDTNLKANRPDGLRIGVLCRSGNENSLKHAQDTLSAFSDVSSKKVKGLSIWVERLEAKNTAEVSQAVSKSKLNVLYISPGSDDLIKPVLELARDKKLLTLTGDAKLVKRGVAIGVVKRNNKPKIMVNMQAIAAQGGKLSSRMLRLVELVE